MSVYLQVMGIIMHIMNIACWYEINTLPDLVIYQYGIIYVLGYHLGTYRLFLEFSYFLSYGITK